MREKFNPKAKVSEFKADMGKNPLGDNQIVRTSGEIYIIEYYSDSIAGKQLQIYRKAKPHENHFRKWKKVSDFQDYDGDLLERFENLKPQEIRDMDN